MSDDFKHPVLAMFEWSERARKEALSRLGLSSYESVSDGTLRVLVGLLERIEALEAKTQ